MGRRKFAQQALESEIEYLDDGPDFEPASLSDDSDSSSDAKHTLGNSYNQGSGRPFPVSQPPLTERSQSQEVVIPKTNSSFPSALRTRWTDDPNNGYPSLSEWAVRRNDNDSSPSLGRLQLPESEPSYPAQSQYAHPNPSVNSEQGWNHAQSNPSVNSEQVWNHAQSNPSVNSDQGWNPAQPKFLDDYLDIILRNDNEHVLQFFYEEGSVPKRGSLPAWKIGDSPRTKFLANSNYRFTVRGWNAGLQKVRDVIVNKTFTVDNEEWNMARHFQ